MTHDTRITLRLALLWLRLALGAHVFYWGLAIWEGAAALQALPLLEPNAMHPRLGVIVLVVGVLTIAGLWRPVSYGLTLFLQALVTFGDYGAWLDPFSAGMGRSISEVPILGAAVALFILRDQDSFFSADLGFAKLSRSFNRYLPPPPLLEPEPHASPGLGSADRPVL